MKLLKDIIKLCAYKKLPTCVGSLATPPKMVDYVLQPVEEDGLSFYLCCLEKRKINITVKYRHSTIVCV